MTRALIAGLALTASSCGLLIDGAYLLSGNKSFKDVEQRRPTGQEQTVPEHRLGFEGPHVRVVCEDVTRGVDRVWSVHKTYENQGGWYQAHWLPIILEGAIGGVVVEDQHLGESLAHLGRDAIKDRRDGGGGVVGDDQHTDLHR